MLVNHPREPSAEQSLPASVGQHLDSRGGLRLGPDIEDGTGRGSADRCDACEMAAARLYLIPVHRRRGDRAPRIACYFCYLRAVGASPRRQQLVSRHEDGPR
jgi:hypothetical protein